MANSKFNQDSNTFKNPPYTKIVNDVPVQYRDVCVHEFSLGDVEDPDIYAADPILKWQETEAGQWVMQHSVDSPYWLRSTDHTSWGYKYKIVARFKNQDEVFWKLKFCK